MRTALYLGHGPQATNDVVQIKRFIASHCRCKAGEVGHCVVDVYVRHRISTVRAARQCRWSLTSTRQSYCRKTEEDEQALEIHTLHAEKLAVLPVTSQQPAKATERDPVLSKVLLHVLHGKVPEELQAYFTRRLELSQEAGVVMWGIRVVVPPSLRPHLLEEIHSTHMGVVRMKALAKMHMWWPQISKEIEALARECKACQKKRSFSRQSNPSSLELAKWTIPKNLR